MSNLQAGGREKEWHSWSNRRTPSNKRAAACGVAGWPGTGCRGSNMLLQYATDSRIKPYWSRQSVLHASTASTRMAKFAVPVGVAMPTRKPDGPDEVGTCQCARLMRLDMFFETLSWKESNYDTIIPSPKGKASKRRGFATRLVGKQLRMVELRSRIMMIVNNSNNSTRTIYCNHPCQRKKDVAEITKINRWSHEKSSWNLNIGDIFPAHLR